MYMLRNNASSFVKTSHLAIVRENIFSDINYIQVKFYFKFEISARTSIRMGQTCENPIAIEAQPIANNTGSTQTTHIDIDIGFYCINEEQANNELCGEFEVRYCCPRTSFGSCDQKVSFRL